MRVIVDSMFFLELLNVPQLPLRMRACDSVTQGFVRVKQNLLEAARETHPLVVGQIFQNGSKPFLQSNGNIDSLDFDRLAATEELLTKGQVVTVEILDGI